MRRIAVVLILALHGAGSRGAAAEEPYDIRLHEPGVGDVLRVEKDETLNERVVYQDGLGRILQDHSRSSGEISVYAETVLAKEPNKPASRLRRTYDKAWKRVGDQLKSLAYHGRTVLIERKQDRFHFFLTGRGELTAAEAVLLNLEFNGTDERFGLRHLLPAGAVRAGAYPWVVNMAPLVRDLGRSGKLEADPLRSRGAGQLKRVWRAEDGRLLGEFDFQMELPMTFVKLGRNRLPVAPESKGVSQINLELCIDGSAFHLVQKSTMRIAAIGPYATGDGLLGRVVFSVQADSKGLTQVTPRK